MNVDVEVLTMNQEAIKEKGGILLGNLLWWTLGKNRIRHDQLLSSAQQHQFPEAYLPDIITPTMSYRRVVACVSGKMPKGSLLRKIADTQDSIVHGVIIEEANSSLELEYTHKCTASFEKANANISVSHNSNNLPSLEDMFPKNPLFYGDQLDVSNLRDLYYEFLQVTTEDVRHVMMEFSKIKGISLRDNGGIYFIPDGSTPVLKALRSFIQSIGENTVYVLPLYGLPEAVKTLADLSQKSLSEEIKELTSELDKFDEKTRLSTMQKRIDYFDSMQQKVDLFSSSLHFSQENLLAKLAKAKQQLLDSIVDKEAQIEAKKLAKKNKPITPESVEALQVLDANNDTSAVEMNTEALHILEQSTELVAGWSATVNHSAEALQTLDPSLDTIEAALDVLEQETPLSDMSGEFDNEVPEENVVVPEENVVVPEENVLVAEEEPIAERTSIADIEPHTEEEDDLWADDDAGF